MSGASLEMEKQARVLKHKVGTSFSDQCFVFRGLIIRTAGSSERVVGRVLRICVVASSELCLSP